MFRLLNKSAIWLTTAYEIRQNYPSPALYFSPLIHPTHLHACPWWVAEYVDGRLAVSNFPCYSGAKIHSLGRRAFQAVGSAYCFICKHTSFGLWVGYLLTVYVIFRPHLATCRV